MKTPDQDECVLCCREITIYSVGACDHPVCYECSARMRVLCETNECPICRSVMPLVVFTLQKQPFSHISEKYTLVDKEFQIVFENADIKKSFMLLLENRCNICNEVAPTFNKLIGHVRKEHSLYYCELCTDNLKIFASERNVYSRKDLALHKRVGDSHDTSQRGHPLCEFCYQRYMDTDELFRHVRREHFFCHFCDADGKHEYYGDYEYLKTHFRREHYLCEEGECADEKFTGAFRSEIDLKAHKAVYHSKNKSKAEVRQARTLEFEFTYAPHNRPTGSSSPRGNRFNQQRRQQQQPIEENNSRETKQTQQTEERKKEKINTDSTLEFPFLSEDNASVPNTNLNSATLHSFNRNSVPQRQKNTILSEDFPALVSTTVSVTSDSTNNQSRRFNLSIHRPNSMISRPAEVPAQSKQSETNFQKRETDKKNNKSTWDKMNLTFEDEFPRLESKKPPVNFTNVVHTNVIRTTVANPQNKPAPPVQVTSSYQGANDQFIVIKSKPKKKKQNKAAAEDSRVDSDDKEEMKYLQLLRNNNFNELDTDVEDVFRQNLVHPNNNQRKYVENDGWSQKPVSFGNDDFPPLAAPEPLKRPPGFSAAKKKAPPPGFSVSTNATRNSAPLNISLSSIARQIVGVNLNNIEKHEYIRPFDFKNRNENLASKIKVLPLFDEFKTLSTQFQKNEITAATFYSKCLEILGEKDFLDIFPELICLLPDIHKQQELFQIHKKRQNNSGAVPKHKMLNKILTCDTCQQVLMDADYQNHMLEHGIK